MDTSVQEALKIGLVNDQIHSVVISGGTGVGKSFLVRSVPREMAYSPIGLFLCI